MGFTFASWSVSVGQEEATCRFRRWGTGTEVSPCRSCVRKCSPERPQRRFPSLFHSFPLPHQLSTHYSVLVSPFLLAQPSSFFSVPPPSTELISVLVSPSLLLRLDSSHSKNNNKPTTFKDALLYPRPGGRCMPRSPRWRRRRTRSSPSWSPSQARLRQARIPVVDSQAGPRC